jgi:formate dehydrogenase maturation protein FdhE
MASEDYASNLLKVSELRRAIKNKFTAKMLQDQGLERDLTQIYKPLTESQTKTTRDITTHLSKLSNESQTKNTRDITALLSKLSNEANTQVKSLLDAVPADLRDIMSEEKAVYEHVSKLVSADELKTYLSNDTNANNLLRYVELNPKTNLKSNPWRRIRTELPDFYNEIKTLKKGTV